MRAPARTLLQQGDGCSATIDRVLAPVQAPDWALRLEEIGFLPGERVTITARGQPSGEPLAVRVGGSTFALRRAEAACIHLVADESP
jgi:ferrous iron transport protein A